MQTDQHRLTHPIVPDVKIPWAELRAGIADRRLGRVADAWFSLRDGREIPRREDLAPDEFPKSLPVVWLLDRSGPGQFNYRLAGDEISESHGGIRRGADVNEVFPPQSVALFSLRWNLTLDGPNVVHVKGTVRLTNGVLSDVERLMLPVADRNGVPVTILGATIYKKFKHLGPTTKDFMVQKSWITPAREIPLAED